MQICISGERALNSVRLSSTPVRTGQARADCCGATATSRNRLRPDAHCYHFRAPSRQSMRALIYRRSFILSCIEFASSSGCRRDGGRRTGVVGCGRFVGRLSGGGPVEPAFHPRARSGLQPSAFLQIFSLLSCCTASRYVLHHPTHKESHLSGEMCPSMSLSGANPVRVVGCHSSCYPLTDGLAARRFALPLSQLTHTLHERRLVHLPYLSCFATAPRGGRITIENHRRREFQRLLVGPADGTPFALSATPRSRAAGFLRSGSRIDLFKAPAPGCEQPSKSSSSPSQPAPPTKNMASNGATNDTNGAHSHGASHSRPLTPGIFAPIPTFFKPDTEDLGMWHGLLLLRKPTNVLFKTWFLLFPTFSASRRQT